MKRSFIILVLSLLPLFSAFAQQTRNTTATGLLKSYEDIDAFRCFELSGSALSFAKPFIKTTPAGALVRNTKAIYICSIDEKYQDDMNNFLSKALTTLDTSYNKLAEQGFNGTNNIIFIDSKSVENFSEIVMLITGKGKVSAFVFQGNFSKTDLEEMAKKAAKQEIK